jgi:hypothetical protein
MPYTYPVPPIGSIHLVTLNMLWVGSRMMNTYYYRLETNPNATTVKALADQMDAAFTAGGHLYPTHTALRDASSFLTNVAIQQIAPTRIIPQVYAKNINGDYLISLDASNLAAVITRRGVNATRGDVGSVHIPCPIDPTVFVDGDWTVVYRDKLTAHAGVMQTNLALTGGATLSPVIYHRGQVPNFSYVGSAFYQANLRVMRRRTKGIGI